MEIQETYAKKWNINAEHFPNNNSYLWMCSKINSYKTVLEIGCGTGQSTLALLKNGHRVIAIEKNLSCIDAAKTLIGNSGYKVESIENSENDFDALIINKDLLESEDYIKQYSFDIVICLNVGSYWDRDMAKYYSIPMLRYGLTLEQIKKDPESSYAELVLWYSCRIANEYSVPIHIVDRCGEEYNSDNDPYYFMLKNEWGFSNIK